MALALDALQRAHGKLSDWPLVTGDMTGAVQVRNMHLNAVQELLVSGILGAICICICGCDRHPPHDCPEDRYDCHVDLGAAP
jgi:hypothetical protein